MREIQDLRETLESSRDEFRALQNKLIEKTEKIKQLEETVDKIEQKNIELHETINEKSDYNEQYSRKDSLRINGLPIQPNETHATLQSALIDNLENLGVTIKNSDIHRIHRSGKNHPINKFKQHLNNINSTKIDIDQADRSETAELIVRFTNWNGRAKVYDLHYQKNTHILVKCDLTKHRQSILSDAKAYLVQHELKGYAYNTAECRLALKDAHADRRYFYKNLKEFKELSANLTKDGNFHKRRSIPR